MGLIKSDMALRLSLELYADRHRFRRARGLA